MYFSSASRGSDLEDFSFLCQCPHAGLIQEKHPEKNLTILFGGLIAECRANPHTTQGYHGHQEYKIAVESALRFCEGQQEEARAFLRWLEIRSRNILRKDWPLVEVLAMELLARNTIAGKSVERLLAAKAR